ncbi:nuclear transcription factor Y subunit B-9-like [Apium graveolens]|uniref:nuclear transcription factor Y subunit B-9-like n=1 Tax=Apium graveolens TaxID=4045 RepID=UPI003D79E531
MVPNDGVISAGAVISIQECVSKFIRFMTTQANTRCMEEKRTTITGEDVLIAMNNHGVYRYIGPLFLYLNHFGAYGVDEHPRLRGELPEIRSSFDTSIGRIGATSELDYDIQGVMAVTGFVRDGHSDGPSGSAAGSNGNSLP